MCGTPIPIACEQCRATNPPESRFCHRCGVALSPDRTPLRLTASRQGEPTIKHIGTDLKVLGADLAAYAVPRIKKGTIFIGRNAKNFGAYAAPRIKKGTIFIGRNAKNFGAYAARQNRKSSAEIAHRIRASADRREARAQQQALRDATSATPDTSPHDADPGTIQGTPQIEAAANCPRCSSVNQPGSIFCFNCGLPLDDTPTAPRQTTDYAGRPAGFWIRLAAALVDTAVLVTAQLAIIAIWPGLPEYFESDSMLHWVDAPLVILTALYHTIGVSVWSTTVGKRVLGLYVLRPDGSKVRPHRALARYFASGISFLILGVGYLMIAFNQHKRSLHDLICDTKVVRR